MKHLRILIATAGFLAGSTVLSWGASGLFDRGYNIDGDVRIALAGDVVPPPGVDESGIGLGKGVGTVQVTVAGGGAHYVGFYVDHEIDELVNTFFNEFGSVNGAPPAGLSWEIDEPEFVFGDIVSNFTIASLDNSNGVPAGMEDDVSMALGWNFLLADNEFARVRFSVTEEAPAGGFYLQQTDPDSDMSIYFTSTLEIIPEPSSGAGGCRFVAVGILPPPAEKCVRFSAGET